MADDDAVAKGSTAAASATARERAAATLDAVQRQLYVWRRGLYGTRRFLGARKYEALWPFAGAWSAVVTMSSLTDELARHYPVARTLGGLSAYHRDPEAAIYGTDPVAFESMPSPPLGPGGDVYYDDNAWVALAALAQHHLSGEAVGVKLASRILEFLVTGWSTVPDWAHPGGIRWKVPTRNRSRNTCSNGPSIEVAAEIHRGTGSAAALEFAQRAYRWTSETLRRSDDLYADRIDPDGTVHHELWSYNQGTMIGAGVLLGRVTGENRYLEEASATAVAALRHFSPEVMVDQLEAFNAVLLRNAMLLEDHTPGEAAFRQLALDYGELMWSTRRDHRRKLFVGPGDPLNHNAPMIEVYALAAGAAGHP